MIEEKNEIKTGNRFENMTNDEFASNVRDIAEASSSSKEIRRRLVRELQYPKDMAGTMDIYMNRRGKPKTVHIMMPVHDGVMVLKRISDEEWLYRML